MKNYELVEIKESKIKSIECDFCKKVYSNEFEIDEFISFYHYCGYGSIFGDGNEIEIDICQQCFLKMLKDNNIENRIIKLNGEEDNI